ncbi:methylated-DNA--[protein]-cysteine S-methyltransferase [Piscinibacter sp.]|uniref:methylated-DNA--[protein]-cysteine S-methyltransferase n=1 Tax=Piscinibacter sp. TaxID=1903157 RepID=UPI002B57B936|nr:methylated-DNA--[protein]-cysteine S-methyltransferase [Albitalea sp.]HUG21593.1 methylated-DNA--[protein]-cysteine S-methyltransferase [Albitalea sp.]
MSTKPEPLHAVVAETALGYAGVALSRSGIRYATLFHTTRESCEGELAAHGADFDPDARAEELIALLKGYALGEASLDYYPVDTPPGGELQTRVWAALRDVPRGETRSYGWLTRHVGEPMGAARAVGAAVGSNPIPLWLPCHRIIGADGSLHGFGGGLAMKQALLEVEGALPKALI